MISTEQVAIAAATTQVMQGREEVLSMLSCDYVQSAFVKRGIDPLEAKLRIPAFTDDEANCLVTQIDESPAGAGGVIGAIILVFFVLLLTDIIGFTKVFPFTRSLR